MGVEGGGACKHGGSGGGGVGLVQGEGLVALGGFIGGHAAGSGSKGEGGVSRGGGETVDGFVHEGGEGRVRIVHVEI